LLPLHTLAMRFGWLLMDSIYGALRGMWANGGLQWPEMHHGVIEGVYGWGVLLLGLALGAGLVARYRAQPTRHGLAVLSLYCMAFLGLTGHVLMLLVRVRNEADPQALLGYFIGSRYLLFPALYLVLLGGAGLLAVAPMLRRGLTVTLVVVTLGAAAGTATFAIVAAPALWPWLQSDTHARWQLAVDHARQDMAHGKPVTDDALAGLDIHFKATLKQRKQLLEHELGCHDCVHFVDE